MVLRAQLWLREWVPPLPLLLQHCSDLLRVGVGLLVLVCCAVLHKVVSLPGRVVQLGGLSWLLLWWLLLMPLEGALLLFPVPLL